MSYSFCNQMKLLYNTHYSLLRHHHTCTSQVHYQVQYSTCKKLLTRGTIHITDDRIITVWKFKTLVRISKVYSKTMLSFQLSERNILNKANNERNILNKANNNNIQAISSQPTVISLFNRTDHWKGAVVSINFVYIVNNNANILKKYSKLAAVL